ncbi:MAG: hypothetical protein IKY33_03205 [Clostridia bacterium]|nr:hypothetical protein [Clostridia bacterium]
MEQLNTVNDVQAPVVEAQDTVGSGEAEVTSRPQSMQENAAFKRMRQENERLRAENERYVDDQLHRQMEQDLADIRKMDASVVSLEELGEEFFSLVAAGIAAPVAFAALRESRRAVEPPAMGQLENGGVQDKEFYRPEEVDALSPAQLADPAVWQKVRSSMTKW